MTQKKQLKARVRARMARTGESYVTALRHVTSSGTPGASGASGASGALNATTGAAPSLAARAPDTQYVDLGYTLRGGLHPESANIAHVLAHHGIRADGRGGGPQF